MLRLRGGGEGVGGYTGLEDEEVLEEVRSSAELWANVYSRPGVIALCNEAGFDSEVLGESLLVEKGGSCVRRAAFGYSCARSAAVAREPVVTAPSESKTTPGSTLSSPPKIFYFEAQIIGGGSPMPGMDDINFKLPADIRNATGVDVWKLPYAHNTGTVGSGVGVIEAKSTKGIHATPTPFSSMMLLARGGIKVPHQPDGHASILGKLGFHHTPRRDEHMLQSGDRMGVLVDFREGKIGFLRNGTMLHELTQVCRL